MRDRSSKKVKPATRSGASAAVSSRDLKTILVFQRNEITEYHVYRALAGLSRPARNRSVLLRIADEEMRHYRIWSRYSGQQVKPSRLRRWIYTAIAAVFGVTFGIKFMEKGEVSAQRAYADLSRTVPEAGRIQLEEHEHERRLIDLIDEDHLKYTGSVVLGLNDALVEFTGALAGFTFALQQSRLIGMVGLIMGISASLSMAASEYLSTKADPGGKDPVRSSFYTGTAYFITVAVLVTPYFLFHNHYLSLAVTLACSILLILGFTFYFSVVRGVGFKTRFLEMLGISMGVAALSFVISLVVKQMVSL
jgi:VIT1/CCC1 family predicted Fe2+/Mn2+ transporter